MVHALPDLLLHPHAPSAGAAAEPALAVVRRDLDPLHAGDRVEDRARLVVHAVVPAEVARVVIGDGLGHAAPHSELSLGDEAVDELQRVDDLVGAAQLRVLVREGVEAVRAARDDLLHLVLLEGVDVLLRLQLPEVLVADAARGIAVARLLSREDRERHSRRLQDLDQRDRDLLIAAVDRGGAADEVQVLGIRPLREGRHAEVARPIAPRLARRAPGIAGALDVRHRALRLGRRRSLHERQVPAHVDDLVDVLDGHRARLDACGARRARPELLRLGFDVMRRRRRLGLRVLAMPRPVTEQLIADVEHDLLGVEGLPRRERGAVVGAAAALGAGVAVEELLPREVPDRRGAERLLVLDVRDEVEGSPRALLPEEDVRQGGHDVQVLRPRQVRREREHRHDVRPPGHREHDPGEVTREHGAEDPVRDRRRGVALLEESRGKAGALEDQERDHEEPDHPQDHVAVERDVHPRRAEEEPARRGDSDRTEHEHREEVDRPREDDAAGPGNVKAEDAVHQQIDRADGDDEKAPKDERVRDTAYVVRALQQLALAEVDDELVAHAPPGMIDPGFVAPEAHIPVKLVRPPEERAEAEHGQAEEDRASDHEAAGGRGHRFTPSGSPRR